MGKAIESIVFMGTAMGAGGAMTALSGNSLTVRDSRKPVKAFAQLCYRQGEGRQSITSPSLHDTTEGIVTSARPAWLVATGPVDFSGFTVDAYPVGQALTPQDTLTVTGVGSSTVGATEFGALWVKYEDLPGVDGRFMGHMAISKAAKNLVGVRLSLTGAASDYSEARAIVADVDRLRANTDYAIIGVQSSSLVGGVLSRFRGPDWGNLGIVAPMSAGNGYPWFVGLEMMSGVECCPVFNSANRDLVLVDILCDDTVDGSANLVIQLVELGGRRS